MDDNTSQQLTSSVDVVNPEEYGRKRAQILAAKAYLERLENDNEAGRAQYESELLQKVREGDQARQRLQELQHYHNSKAMGPLTIEAAPITARIEDVPVSPPLPQSAQFTPALMYNQKSFQSSLPHGTQPTTRLPPSYQSFIQQPPHREYQSYSGPPFRQSAPQTQNPAVPQSQSVRVQQGQPGFYHYMPTANYKQQVDNFHKSVQHQKPSVPRRTRPSSSQIPVQSQVQTNGVPGSVFRVQVNGVGNTYQDVQTPVHYNPTGGEVHPVGTSSLMGALGPQTSPSVQPSASPPLASSASRPTVAEGVPKPPRVDQVPTSASNLQSTGTRPAALPESEMEDRKLKVLAFRSSILEWEKNAQPNTYTEFHKIKVYKALNSALYITSLFKGKEIIEEQHIFFERLWVTAGLPQDAIPFKQGSTSGPPSVTVAAGHSVPSTAPRALGTPTQSVSAQAEGGHSVSTAPHTRTAPKTPRRTLVDPISGSWRSPADADRRRLARDVMHALGKRKQDFSHSSPNENPSKRRALDAPSTSGSVHRISEPVARSTITATALPALQVTSQHTNQQLQSEVTSKPVAVTEADRIPLEPPVEPPPSTIVAPSAAPHSPSESSPLQKNGGPSNSQEPHSFPTPSTSSVQYSLANGNPRQFNQQSGSLPTEGPSTTPTTLSPVRAHATSPTSLQQEPRESAPVTPVTRSMVALPNTTCLGASASPIISHDEPDNQSHSSTKLAANPEPLVSAQVEPASARVEPSSAHVRVEPVTAQVEAEPSSSSQLSQNEQDAPTSLLVPHDQPSGVVLTAGFDIPQEASSFNVREPLFLPSPSPSSSSLPSKKNKRSSSVYVLVPPPPEYLIRYRKRQRMKDELDSQKDNTRTSSLVSTFNISRSLEAFSLPLERERDIPIDPYEQEAIQFSCSRLQPMPCRWGECDTILNSVDALIHHLNREHKPAGISFICRWTQCGRHCRSHEKHLERHAMMTLQCAYQGCKESYRASSQLLKHFRSKHLNGVLKVQAKPFHPHPQAPVPLPNTILPSYLIVTPPVTPTPISPDEHSMLEPWVLRNVAGFDIERPKRARKASGYGSTEELQEETSNTYEFLNMRSTRYSWNQSEPVAMDFDDLDSEEISKECDQGLTFFGTDSEDIGVEAIPPSEEEASPSPLFSSPPINGDANAETVRSERLDWQTTTEPSDEEDVVQKLLVD